MDNPRGDVIGTVWVSALGVALAGLFALFKVRQVGDFVNWSWWTVAAPLLVVPVIVTVVAYYRVAVRPRTDRKSVV